MSRFVVCSRPLAALAGMLLVLSIPQGALAQSATGEIDLNVVDAGGKALGNVRTFLLGAQNANALTTGAGAIVFTDVPVGIYRVRMQLRGYDGATTREFDVLPDRAVHVRISLTKMTPEEIAARRAGLQGRNGSVQAGADPNLKVIATVVARPKIAITSTDINADSPIRRLSDSLTDALDKLAGVSVTGDATDPNAPVQISLHNQDESQTALTLDGVPLSAPGSAGNLRGIGTDLFSGSSVSFTPTAGGLAGSANFSTLSPTQALQVRASGTTGTFDRSNYLFATTGSVGNLGFVAEHTDRLANSPLSFRDYEDQSGLAYPHGGESMSESDLLKLRYALGDERTSITAAALDTNRRAYAICAQDVTLFPCGIGPDNYTDGRYGMAYGSLQSLIGNVQTSFTAYANASTQNTDDLDRYILALNPGADPAAPSSYVPTLSPSASTTTTLTRGVAFTASLAQGNHTFNFNGNTYAAINQSIPLAGSSYVTPYANAASSTRYQFSDVIKSNDKLTWTPSLSFADTSGLGGSFLAGLNTAWTPRTNDAYSFSANVGSSQPNLSAVGSFSDPVAARFNCQAQTAVVSGPGDTGESTRQSAFAANANWTHRFNGGATLAANAFSQLQTGQLINALIAEPASYFNGAGSGYLQTLYSAYHSPSVCGLQSAAPTVYVQEAVAGTRRLYQGIDLSGRFELSPYVAVIPSYSLNLAVLEAASDRLNDGPSTAVLGAELPNRPMHKANITLDGLMPKPALELLANAQYVGANNQQNLGPYVNVSFGASHRFGPGQLTLFENNAFNTYAGVFATNANAQPLPLSDGGTYLTAATPLTPRTIFLSYAVAVGGPAPGPAFKQFVHTRGAQLSPTPEPSQSPEPARRQRITAYPPPPGTDPLMVAAARPSCDAASQAPAKTLLDALRAYATAYEKGEKSPHAPGLMLAAYKTPPGSAVPYFITVRSSMRRPANLGQGAGARGMGGAGRSMGGGRFGAGFGLGGGEGAGPQEAPPGGGEVTGGSTTFTPPTPEQQAARRKFENEPAVKAYRSFIACAYVTVLSQADAQAKGIVSEGGRPGLLYAPGIGLLFVQGRELPQGGGSLKKP